MSTYRNGGLFLLLSILWGIAFMAIKAGLEFMPPVLFAAIRYDIAGIIMLGYAVAATEYWRPRTRTDWLTILVGATFVIAFYNAFLFIGEQGVTSGVAAIFVAVNPILATGFSRVFLPGERLTPVATIGLGLCSVGVGLVASPNLSNLLVISCTMYTETDTIHSESGEFPYNELASLISDTVGKVVNRTSGVKWVQHTQFH
ncbi:DMT family transporter [Haladaptatus sp. DYF46]|uniref:DMT family transporter n=1 Tax=Haladaptatus sp. DYF46 TaxID=2886041 RepID=UPI001E47DB55|nr:DMT family transporter [Haladaptatus sp. DYF46]